MQLGAYEVVRGVGRGGAGAVFEGRAPDGRRVAIKLLTRTGPDALARFERERRLLTDLSAAGGIVPVLDAGASREGVYLVMPFMPGGTLRERLAGGRLEVDDALSLARVLAATVARCHARGVIHRDLKPENVLLDGDGQPLVADLGLAKHFRHDAPGASRSAVLSRTGELRGTAGYAAPEQLHDARDVGPPADVFALGAIVYEALAGVPAFRGESTLDVLRDVDEGRLEPLARARPGLPRWLVDVVHRALAHDPGDRYADAGALLVALEGPTASSGPRPRTLALAAVAVMAPLIAAVAVLVTRPERAPSPAPAPTAPAPPATSSAEDEARRWLERGRVELAALDLPAAARDFERATELDPTLAAAWAGRAWALEAYAIEGSPNVAVTFAERAVTLDPGAPSSWIARSFARARGEPRGAEEDARHAVDLAPRDPQAHIALGHAIGVGGDWPAAVPHLEAALALDPGEPHALLLRCLARPLDRDHEATEADLRRVLERAPRSHLALRLLARHREARGDVSGALAALRAATEADPEDPRGWHELGLLDRSAAEAAFTRVIELGFPPRMTPYRHRGEARLVRGELAAAQEDLERATAADPGSGAAWYLLGQTRLARRDFAAAESALTRAVELDPQRGQAWLYLAEARASQGRLRPALAAVDRAAALLPDHPAVHFSRSQLLLALGDRDGARAALERFLAVATPTTPRVEEARALLERLRR